MIVLLLTWAIRRHVTSNFFSNLAGAGTAFSAFRSSNRALVGTHHVAQEIQKPLRSAAEELRKRALGVADGRTRMELLILAEQYEQLSERTEKRLKSYIRAPKSTFN